MATSTPFLRPDSTALYFTAAPGHIDEPQQLYNTENFIVIWLDKTIDETIDNIKMKTQIRSIVNCLKTFDTLQECVQYIMRIKDEKIFFIVSGSFGQQVVPEIQHIIPIESIYIFCAQKNKHEQWAKSFEKVRGIFNDIGIICDCLKRDIQQCSNNLVSFAVVSATDGKCDEDLNKQEISFMHLVLIKDIFIQMKHEATTQQLLNGKEEMIVFFRQQYTGNEIGLQLIDAFENDYCPQTSLTWYTRACFIYDTLNKALRTLDIDILYKLRYFISNLHEHLNELHLESTSVSVLNKVYRGQALTNIQFQKLNDNRGGLLSMNNFLSTTTDCQVALSYAMTNVGRQDFVPVIFEIDINRTINSNAPFASIRDVSHFETENEVLFSMGSVFRIGSIEQLTDDVWIINLQLADTEDKQLRTLTDYMRKEIDRPNNLASLAVIMLKMGEFEKSNSFFKILLDDMTLQDDIRGLSLVYNDIGVNYQERGDYTKALEYYEKSIDILAPHLESIQKKYPDDSLLSSTYNNIGMIHKGNSDYRNALKYITQALECEQNSTQNQQLIATYYQNPGMIYDEQVKYPEALEMFHTALDIGLNYLPSQHPVVAATYCNIGSVYYNQNNFDDALKMFNKTLELELLSVPPTHVSLGFTYNNIAFAYYGLEKYEQALINMTKSVDITLKTLSPDHPLAIERRAGLDMMTGNSETTTMKLFCDQYVADMTKSS